MITKTAVLTGSGSGTVDATLIVGPVDAPYDALLSVTNISGNLAVESAPFSLAADAGSDGDWYLISKVTDVPVHLQEGDSLYAAVYNGFAYVTCIANPSA